MFGTDCTSHVRSEPSWDGGVQSYRALGSKTWDRFHSQNKLPVIHVIKTCISQLVYDRFMDYLNRQQYWGSRVDRWMGGGAQIPKTILTNHSRLCHGRVVHSTPLKQTLLPRQTRRQINDAWRIWGVSPELQRTLPPQTRHKRKWIIQKRISSFYSYELVKYEFNYQRRRRFHPGQLHVTGV